MHFKLFLFSVFLSIVAVDVQARYYDAGSGRFITPDSIVQNENDPQALNRYTYVRNNPIALIDPSGHSWLSKNLRKVVPFINPFIQPQWTAQSVKENKEAYIAGALGYLTSGGNPVVGFASFWTEMGMQTGEGRQATNNVAEEVFADVFGMSAKNAYIFSNIAIRMASIAAMERMWVQIAPNQLKAVPLSKKPQIIEGGSTQEGSLFGPPADEGAEGDSYYSLMQGKDKMVGTIMDRPLTVAKSITGPLRFDHTGVNLIGYNGTTVPSHLYGSWGVCHTSVNRSLFQAGYGSTVSSLGVGGWSTGLSTTLYGIYGGGLYRAIYWGYDAKN